MPRAYCFDMYGTLFDTSTVRTRMCDRINAPEPFIDEVVQLWRTKQLTYSFQLALMDAYEPFWDVTATALEYALDYYDLHPAADDIAAILAAYETLDLYPAARDALLNLSSTETKLAILSNGNPDMLETLADNAGIIELFDVMISADAVRTFKPAPAVYENAAAELEVPLADCWLVSGNAWDVAGATHAGMEAAWVNRANEPFEPIGGDPTKVIRSLDELPTD